MQKSAQAAAILGTRMAERIADLHREAGEESYTAEQALPKVLSDMTYADSESDAAQILLQAALNVGVDLDQEVPVLDITNYVVEPMNKEKILGFIKEIIDNGDLFLTADECASIGIVKKDDKHITYSSKKVRGVQESVRSGVIY